MAEKKATKAPKTGGKKTGTESKPAKAGVINLSAAKCISLHFSPRLIDLESVLVKLAAAGLTKSNKAKCIIHAFMPPEAVEAAKLDPELGMAISSLTKKEKNFFSEGAPKRKTMMTNIKEDKAVIVTVGPLKDGVLEEYNLACQMCPDNIRISL